MNAFPWRYYDSTGPGTGDMFAEIGQLCASVCRTSRGRWEVEVSTHIDVRRSHHDERADAVAAAEKYAEAFGRALIGSHESELAKLRAVWP